MNDVNRMKLVTEVKEVELGIFIKKIDSESAYIMVANDIHTKPPVALVQMVELENIRHNLNEIINNGTNASSSIIDHECINMFATNGNQIIVNVKESSVADEINFQYNLAMTWEASMRIDSIKLMNFIDNVITDMECEK